MKEVPQSPEPPALPRAHHLAYLLLALFIFLFAILAGGYVFLNWQTPPASTQILNTFQTSGVTQILDKQIYFSSHSATAPPDADSLIFIFSWETGDGSHYYAKDTHHVYDNGEILELADPATFVVVSEHSDYDAQDKNHKYLQGEIVE